MESFCCFCILALGVSASSVIIRETRDIASWKLLLQYPTYLVSRPLGNFWRAFRLFFICQKQYILLFTACFHFFKSLFDNSRRCIDIYMGWSGVQIELSFSWFTLLLYPLNCSCCMLELFLQQFFGCRNHHFSLIPNLFLYIHLFVLFLFITMTLPRFLTFLLKME